MEPRPCPVCTCKESVKKKKCDSVGVMCVLEAAVLMLLIITQPSDLGRIKKNMLFRERERKEVEEEMLKEKRSWQREEKKAERV